MKKAFLVSANVMTRVVVDVEDDNTISDELHFKIVDKAKDNLLYNLTCDYYDCVEDVTEDIEVPYGSLLDEKDCDKYFCYNNLKIVSRVDYESLPCPMYAHEFSDEQMQNLALLIYIHLNKIRGISEKDLEDYFNTDINNKNEDIDFAFWEEMENIAINLGMRYYEDMTDDEYKQIVNKN